MDYERHEFQQPIYGSVNVYRVGDTLVDTGHLAPVSHEAVAAALADGPLAGVERVVLTHPHVDHSGGSQTIPELAALPHVVFEGVPDIVADLNAYLERAHAEMEARGAGLDGDASLVEGSYFPLGDYEEVNVERVVGDGDTVRLGEHECEVVHTPGHSTQHMALWHAESGVMVSADLVSTNGHFMYGPLHADVGAYRDSLRRLRTYDADVLLPGHGPVMEDPAARIDDALAKAAEAETSIREAVAAAAGPVPASALARDVFGANDVTVGFLTFVACEYLEHLAATGDLDVEYRDDGVYATTA